MLVWIGFTRSIKKFIIWKLWYLTQFDYSQSSREHLDKKTQCKKSVEEDTFLKEKKTQGLF